MKKNFLDELLLLLGNNPEKYMIEHSLFFSKDAANMIFTFILLTKEIRIHILLKKSFRVQQKQEAYKVKWQLSRIYVKSKKTCR